MWNIYDNILVYLENLGYVEVSFLACSISIGHLGGCYEGYFLLLLLLINCKGSVMNHNLIQLYKKIK